ncbi:MAG: aminoacyl--tRNA ligase-related protein [Acidimicrobiales bacterium]
MPGLAWAGSGQATLWGPLLELAERLDRRFAALARRWHAEELRFPPCIAAADLERIDYFRSFPHLATFPVCLDSGDDNLARFTAGDPVDAKGHLVLSEVAPVGDVLTPAACYHLYAHHRGRRFDDAGYFTTLATCFRREEHYVPLERQWSFTMREIVCLGTAHEVRAFLDGATTDVEALAAELALPLTWATATDPFFQPSRNPKYLMQRVDPTKRELLFDDRLAVASTNLHHDHFGRAFDIARTTADGDAVEPVHSACVAFGIERWLAAVVHLNGPDPAGWPQVGA